MKKQIGNIKGMVAWDQKEYTNVDVEMILPEQITVYAGSSTIIPLDIKNHSDFDIEDVLVVAWIIDAAIHGANEWRFTLSASSTLTIYLAATCVVLRDEMTTLNISLVLPEGISNSRPDYIQHDVMLKTSDDITVAQELDSHVQKGDGFLFNFSVIIGAYEEIDKWQITFSLTNGSVLDPDWLRTQDWFDLDQSTTTGDAVTLVSRPGKKIAEGHTFIGVSILSPGNGPVYHVIHNLGFAQFA